MSAEESDEPNYDSLREESRKVDSSEGLRSGDREAAWNDSEEILERHPRDLEDAERQLDILYQRQLDLEKRKMNPKCDCEYCLKLRAHTPRAAAAVAHHTIMAAALRSPGGLWKIIIWVGGNSLRIFQLMVLAYMSSVGVFISLDQTSREFLEKERSHERCVATANATTLRKF